MSECFENWKPEAQCLVKFLKSACLEANGGGDIAAIGRKLLADASAGLNTTAGAHSELFLPICRSSKGSASLPSAFGSSTRASQCFDWPRARLPPEALGSASAADLGRHRISSLCVSGSEQVRQCLWYYNTVRWWLLCSCDSSALQSHLGNLSVPASAEHLQDHSSADTSVVWFLGAVARGLHVRPIETTAHARAVWRRSRQGEQWHRCQQHHQQHRRGHQRSEHCRRGPARPSNGICVSKGRAARHRNCTSDSRQPWRAAIRSAVGQPERESHRAYLPCAQTLDHSQCQRQ
mmetsp:Transcript_92770/g.203130  ORF Transcript_92770/g.203130 Transcript_92770/m.203130 type:complete len:292 (-) Transcript_92770:901-1776(-)